MVVWKGRVLRKHARVGGGMRRVGGGGSMKEGSGWWYEGGYLEEVQGG